MFGRTPRTNNQMDEIVVGLMKAIWSGVSTGQGGPEHHAAVHRGASFLATLDLAHPDYGGLLGSSYMQGILLLCAAGALLVLEHCVECAGITRLQTSGGRVDESEALVWVDRLLTLGEGKPALTDNDDDATSFPEPTHTFIREMREPINFTEPDSFCGSALGLALAAGHIRIVLELLNRGASRSKRFVTPLCVARATHLAADDPFLGCCIVRCQDALVLTARGYSPRSDVPQWKVEHCEGILHAGLVEGFADCKDKIFTPGPLVWAGDAWRCLFHIVCKCGSNMCYFEGQFLSAVCILIGKADDNRVLLKFRNRELSQPDTRLFFDAAGINVAGQCECIASRSGDSPSVLGSLDEGDPETLPIAKKKNRRGGKNKKKLGN
jgi:hypothetical protein